MLEQSYKSKKVPRQPYSVIRCCCTGYIACKQTPMSECSQSCILHGNLNSNHPRVNGMIIGFLGVVHSLPLQLTFLSGFYNTYHICDFRQDFYSAFKQKGK